LKNAIEQAHKEVALKKVGDQKAKLGRPRRSLGPAASTLAESPQLVCVEISSVVVDAEGKVAAAAVAPAPENNLPKIFRLHADKFNAFKEARVAVNSLATKFKNDPTRADPGRSQRGMKDEQAKEVVDTMQPLLPKDHEVKLEHLHDGQAQDMRVTVFAVAHGRTTASAENGHLASHRLGFKGTRRMICTQTLPLLEFLTGTGAKVELQKCYHWLKTVTTDAAKLYIEADTTKHAIYHATVGPGDVLFLPAGWAFVEVIGTQDFIGVRRQHISGADKVVLSEINRWLLSVEAPNATLQRAVDCLTMIEA
jgi:hypothetical protein